MRKNTSSLKKTVEKQRSLKQIFPFFDIFPLKNLKFSDEKIRKNVEKRARLKAPAVSLWFFHTFFIDFQSFFKIFQISSIFRRKSTKNNEKA